MLVVGNRLRRRMLVSSRLVKRCRCCHCVVTASRHGRQQRAAAGCSAAGQLEQMQASQLQLPYHADQEHAVCRIHGRWKRRMSQ